jgi:hypothetical protein
VRVPEASLAADVARVLDRLEISFALVGAAALAVHGLSRGTHDIDFMTTKREVLRVDWSAELTPPAIVDVRRGDAEDPLAGVVRLSREGTADTDIVVARWLWQQQIIDRSEPFDLELFRARVPDVADLILLKVDAGSYLDQRDAAQLLEIHGPSVVGIVNERVTELPNTLQLAWQRLIAEMRRQESERNEE